MHIDEITALHAQHVRPGFGTTTPDELDYIQRLIQTHRPKRFIEIGTASGLSTGFIARFMAENGGQSITSVDIDSHFFGAAGQPVGYLARQIYDGTEVDINIHPHHSALDLAALRGPWDMGFVDANHQHPWPTLDTLALAPFLRGPKLVIHHDLQLYRRYRSLRGIGPRVLFNEMPDSHRHADPAGGWNIFSLDLTLDAPILEEVAIGAFSMPWTGVPPIPSSAKPKCDAMLAAHYSKNLQAEYHTCEEAFRVALRTQLIFKTRHALWRALTKLGLRKE